MVKICVAHQSKEEQQQSQHRSKKMKTTLDGVKNILLVSSAKGGVGKSTIACNLAVALSSMGYNIGVLDSDIYGPSIPTMFGCQSQPYIDSGRIIPHTKMGVKLMSMGFLIEKEQATVWRGPMISKMLWELMENVPWCDGKNGKKIDYLIIDTPPGTGDVHLSLADRYNISGAVLVSTPQAVAVDDLLKTISMYQILSVPIIGVIENMSYILRDSQEKGGCNEGHNNEERGNKEYIFGRGNIDAVTQKKGLLALPQIPLDPSLCQAMDSGKIPTYYDPECNTSLIFLDIAKQIVSHLESRKRTTSAS